MQKKWDYLSCMEITVICLSRQTLYPYINLHSALKRSPLSLDVLYSNGLTSKLKTFPLFVIGMSVWD